jgi:hypothetical protein
VKDPPSNRGRDPKIDAQRLAGVREFVDAKPDALLRELAESYREKTGDAVSEPTMKTVLISSRQLFFQPPG